MVAALPHFSITLEPFKPPFSLQASIKSPSRKESNPCRSSRRKSVIKRSLSQEQVVFTTPPSRNPSIAIIGGGLSGLLCASSLDQRGIQSTVFDAGVHGLGGRMATRSIVESHHNLIFDHGAQFFTAEDPRFQNLVQKWMSEGLIREWKGLIGNLESGGRFTPFHNPPAKYIGVQGMRSLADSIIHKGSSLAEIIRPCWISKLEPFNGMWHLRDGEEQSHGAFDAVVIAHSGKCAGRLLFASGLPQLSRQMKRLELRPIWALLAAFEDSFRVPWEGAFVKGEGSVSWMGNNTGKQLGPLNGGGLECWTFLSTTEFAEQTRVHQESIPRAAAERVREEMLGGVERALGLLPGLLPRPSYARVQLWGTAVAANSPGVPCIFDPLGRAGICGDWLLGSSAEAAALSGISLGNLVADFFQGQGGESGEFAVGLDAPFEAVSGCDFAQFPGLDLRDVINVKACT